ncbi:MAG: dihydroneopterin aldolase [Arcobacteraceae bacterium]|nr:dihydroneopterin aldolase [Arcobacteraceae bacterium]
MKVNIKNLTFSTIIGILPHERIQEQQVVINCSFKYKYADGNFVDYAQIAEQIKTLMTEKKFELLEDAVLFIKTYLLERYKIKKLKLSIAKPTILEDCVVSVEN